MQYYTVNGITINLHFNNLLTKTREVIKYVRMFVGI